MRRVRIIARLDVKGRNLIKGVHLEGLRVIGDPNEHAKRYYEQGADELIYMDCVASLYGRSNLQEIVERTAKDVFVPITVGGGVRSVADAAMLLRSGADKVAVNTAAVARPELISEIACTFGSQCVVVSVEGKRREGSWEAYTDNGRERSGRDAVEWIKQAVALGAGEVLLTSIDREGTRKGFDVEFVHAVTKQVSVPVIASGGMGTFEHFSRVVHEGEADAVAVADMLHHKRAGIGEIRQYAMSKGIDVRAHA